jgi:hypothetical protein
MPNFRIYPLDSHRCIFGPALSLYAASDEDALVQAARKCGFAFGAEVWLGGRLVGMVRGSATVDAVANPDVNADLGLRMDWLRVLSPDSVPATTNGQTGESLA